ncbi:MAG: TlpA disulfide reductase family protein [Methylovirgula sp.]|uniref:thiol:disulfide interchange protein TlpA n=1 Tax=Methylovirgula sp. TaxID=1978224 RepID=UPI002F14D254
MSDQETKKRGLPSPVTSIIALGLVVMFIYGMKGWRRNEAASAASCPAAHAIAARLAPLVHGEVAALAIDSNPQPMPALTFIGPDGKPTTLAAFKGRNVLLNLWATWCVPCRMEMPSLDKLQGARGSDDFSVVAVNIDTAKLDRPKAFLKEIGVKNLSFYADNSANIFSTLKQEGKVLGLPTTILVAKDGCDIGTMAGPAKWDSPDALSLISAQKQAAETPKS